MTGFGGPQGGVGRKVWEAVVAKANRRSFDYGDCGVFVQDDRLVGRGEWGFGLPAVSGRLSAVGEGGLTPWSTR